jgi:hypothetical protein
MTSSSPASPSHTGWQVGLFFIVMIGTLVAELPSRLLIGFASGDAPFWSTWLVVSRIVEAVLRLFFVAMMVGLMARPKSPDGKPIITNWFSAFVMAWGAMEIVTVSLRLLLAYLQQQAMAACTGGATGSASMADCTSMGVLGVGFAIVSVAGFALLLFALGKLAKPADGYRVGDNGLMIGAIGGAVLAATGFALTTGMGFVLRGGDGMMFYSLGLPILYAVLDGLIIAVMLGIWRRDFVGHGGGTLSMRFD